MLWTTQRHTNRKETGYLYYCYCILRISPWLILGLALDPITRVGQPCRQHEYDMHEIIFLKYRRSIVICQESGMVYLHAPRLFISATKILDMHHLKTLAKKNKRFDKPLISWCVIAFENNSNLFQTLELETSEFWASKQKKCTCDVNVFVITFQVKSVVFFKIKHRYMSRWKNIAAFTSNDNISNAFIIFAII